MQEARFLKKVSIAPLLIDGWTASSHIVRDVVFLGQQLSIIDAHYITGQSLFGLAELEISILLGNIAGLKNDRKSIVSLLKDS